MFRIYPIKTVINGVTFKISIFYTVSFSQLKMTALARKQTFMIKRLIWG